MAAAGAFRAQWIDTRMRRAVREVLTKYAIGVLDDSSDRVIHGVAKGRKKYTVEVDRGWRLAPSCSCPDMQRVGDKARRGYCKHVIAVLLGSDEHRYQLIDLLL